MEKHRRRLETGLDGYPGFLLLALRLVVLRCVCYLLFRRVRIHILLVSKSMPVLCYRVKIRGEGSIQIHWN